MGGRASGALGRERRARGARGRRRRPGDRAEPAEKLKRARRTGLRPSQPQRTCIACRAVRAKADLIRLVRDEGGVVQVDRDGRAAGRGAYMCATADCVEKALQAGRLGHAFRRGSRPPQETPEVILASRTRR